MRRQRGAAEAAHVDGSTVEDGETTAALVTDARYENAVSGIRGLGRAGVPVVVVGESWSAAGLWSRYSRGRAVTAPWDEDPAAFAATVAQLANGHGPLVIYPATEVCLDALRDHAESLPASVLRPL